MKVRFAEDGCPIFELNPDELYNTPYVNEKQKNINA